MQKAVRHVDWAIDGILSKASGFSIDKIFFVIGNDVLHVDTPRRTTTSGTPQDTSGMWHEAFLEAKTMYVRAIEKMLPVADVHVIFNPSNHDLYVRLDAGSDLRGLLQISSKRHVRC